MSAMDQSLSTQTLLRWLRTLVIFLATLVICLLLLVFYQNRDMRLIDTINKGYLPQSLYGELALAQDMSLAVPEALSLASGGGLSYEIINNSGASYSYGSMCVLEIFIENDWFTVPLQSTFAWDTELYYLAGGDSAELTLSLNGFYTLIPGSYRLVKELTRSPYEQYRDTAYDAYQDDSVLIWAEFEITQ